MKLTNPADSWGGNPKGKAGMNWVKAHKRRSMAAAVGQALMLGLLPEHYAF